MTDLPPFPGNTYDQTPYPVMSFLQTHPDRLSTIARLLGLVPAAVGACRVLELGCASGGNLIPMAYALPGSTFVGVDLSGQQIRDGQAVIEALGLTNITLQHRNILDIGPADGLFDYIIAHGVYSWVPPAVREHVLTIANQNLAPDGIAYISYNTYPGWHMLGAVREMMRYHTRALKDDGDRVREARRLVKFLAASTPAGGPSDPFGPFQTGYQLLVNQQNAYFQDKLDQALLHDELEETNDPYYFYQFIEDAQLHGLQYVAEAEFSMVMPTNLPEAVRKDLFELAVGTTAVEQYMDFLRNRTFRQTLLCHEDAAVSRQLTLAPVMDLWIVSHLQPVSKTPDLLGGSAEQFANAAGQGLTVNQPIVKMALAILAEQSPHAIAFDDLFKRSCTATGRAVDRPTAARDRQLLAANLLQAYCHPSPLIAFHSYQPVTVTTPGNRPIASAYARQQLRLGSKATNLRHENADIADICVLILPALDGRHDRDALIRQLVDLAAAGRFKIHQAGREVEDPDKIRQVLARELEVALNWLAQMGFLVG